MTEPDRPSRESTRAEFDLLKESFGALHAEAYRRSAENTFTVTFGREVEEQMTELNARLAEVRRIFVPQEVARLLGPRLIGPEEIKRVLGVFDLGALRELPSQILEALESDSLITPGKKVFEDHRLIYIPESFDGTPNSVQSLKALVQRAEAERKKLEPGAKPVFSTQDWYEKEDWLKAATTGSRWILTPGSVPNSTKNNDFSTQSEVIVKDFKPYLRGEAHELISLLSLTELSTRERLYPSGTWGWTETITDPAGASSGLRVDVGDFDDDGFGVGLDPPDVDDGSLGAFLCWNFED